ncbi:MAG: tryptophan synthase subunit alpha [Spirochaetales bacterium]|nr:tryptophan synthase subunit alpha [Spirochaetales bacterium]
MSLSDYLRARRPIYMPYLTTGAPDFETTVRAAVILAGSGADILELGIPFSDPTADGPVIQAAMQNSLEQKDFSLNRVFETIGRCHEETGLPVVLLTYSNPVLSGFPGKGLDEQLDHFLGLSRKNGVQGMVLPDLPFDSPEGKALAGKAKSQGIALCPLVSPNTRPERLRKILEQADGFVYYMTRMGVTGEKEEAIRSEEALSLLRQKTALPVLAGFGISTVEQARFWKGQLDGIIVGSLNQRLLAEGNLAELERVTLELVRALKEK